MVVRQGSVAPAQQPARLLEQHVLGRTKEPRLSPAVPGDRLEQVVLCCGAAHVNVQIPCQRPELGHMQHLQRGRQGIDAPLVLRQSAGEQLIDHGLQVECNLRVVEGRDAQPLGRALEQPDKEAQCRLGQVQRGAGQLALGAVEQMSVVRGVHHCAHDQSEVPLVVRALCGWADAAAATTRPAGSPAQSGPAACT